MILIRKSILGPATAIVREEIFPGRDHLVRIRQIDCSSTTINDHFQPEGTLPEIRRRLRAEAASWPAYPDFVGCLLGDFNICDRDEGRLNSRNPTLSNGDAVMLPPSSPASLTPWKLLSPTSRAKTRRDGSVHTAIAY